ncbi:MAG TPA: oligopeptide/dipeptide ABC transporter ATP-binding protein [Galbitalea sp.]|jgi:peptide/nickel transport system ATP-binding protein|nr:oligopeptide/dipeptide ABC transporter ATP-binding protein [Galbitalea sp.]
MSLIDVRDLVVEFTTRGSNGSKVFRAIDGVSFTIEPGETVGLVGESGSGKSTIGRAILGLNPVAEGSITFKGDDITRAHARQRRALAENIQAVFQDPYSSLDPRRTIEDALTEPLRAVKRSSRKDAVERVKWLLGMVRLPANSAERLPSDFSGGQRQRIAIARSLANDPELVVCDEAVSALDVSTQAQVINLLSQLQSELGMSYLFISHDLSIVQYLAQRIVVLYRGRVMESGPAEQVGTQPLHPYTRALLSSAPVSDPVSQKRRRDARRQALVRNEPPATVGPDQCPFAARCPLVADVCWTARPKQVTVDKTTVECHVFDPESGHPDTKQSKAAKVATTASPTA